MRVLRVYRNTKAVGPPAAADAEEEEEEEEVGGALGGRLFIAVDRKSTISRRSADKSQLGTSMKNALPESPPANPPSVSDVGVAAEPPVGAFSFNVFSC